MPAYQVQIKGLKELQRAMRDYPKVAAPIETKALAATQAVFAKNTTRRTVPWVTGVLAQTFQFRSNQNQAVWQPTAKYAAWVELGRGWVFPVNAKALSWATKSGGGYATAASGRQYYKAGQSGRVFAMYSRPSKPHPFIKSIRDASAPEIQRLFLQALQLIVRQIAGQTNIR